jgi:hypothetical protein
MENSKESKKRIVEVLNNSLNSVSIENKILELKIIFQDSYIKFLINVSIQNEIDTLTSNKKYFS